MPTPSGLNLEREELKEPLPADWTKADLKNVTLYQQFYSMPCVKVRAHLTYTLVHFTAREGKKPGSDYEKIPVLDVNGRQINDSAIIVKTLAPIIYGRPLTDEEWHWEQRLTYGTMIAAEKTCFGDATDLKKFAHYVGFDKGWHGFWGLLIPIAAPILSIVIKKKLDKNNPGLLPLDDYLKEYKAALGDREYFTGNSIGPIDVSFVGILVVFEKAGTSFIKAALQKAKLLQYYNSIKMRLPNP
eukprot:CAMPEP_0118942310 /NCGR_PEP_ID=MMETSP1169-20130426/35950_1 /TAXON_ID=36882 /ORGANISM="Pyramimonas obovata, Strain CCMP722" /LENGTH=242 /DNA_ID=CAMNT_0006887315 /DNA_START=60 /DNA_END=785 /DNA_ORIENTATION=+